MEPNIAHSPQIPDFTIRDNSLQDTERSDFHLHWKQTVVFRTEFRVSDLSMGQRPQSEDMEKIKCKKQTHRESTAPYPVSGAQQSPEWHRALALLWVPSVDKNRHSHLRHCSLPFRLLSQASQQPFECDSDLRKGFQLRNFPKPMHSQDRPFLPPVFLIPVCLHPQLISKQLHCFRTAEH